MKKPLSIVAVLSLLMCVACAEQPANRASLTTVTPLQFSQATWEDIGASNQIAHVKNQKLILQR